MAKEQWFLGISKARKEYEDLIYGAFSILKEVDYTREEIETMPLKDLYERLNIYTPKIKELMEQKYGKEMESAMTGSPSPDQERKQRVKQKGRGGR